MVYVIVSIVLFATVIVVLFLLREKPSSYLKSYIDKHGTHVTKLPYVVEAPEGYEFPKYNEETGQAEYSDGTIAEHLELRKIKKD